MKRSPLFFLPLALLWLLPLASPAQVFDFSVIGGATFSQIDGDKSAHFNHIGYQAGVATSFPLGGHGSKLRMHVEIGTIQKGSEIDNEILSRSISLNYVQVPLMITYCLADQDYHFGGLRLGAGFAPGILFKAQVKTDGVVDAVVEGNYQPLDVLPFVAEARYMFGRHIGIAVRYYYSLIHIDKNSSEGTYRILRSNKGQFSNLLFCGLYLRF
ncbi:MAG: outer membrane beta-barrel protein [Bacteroidales bacterium]|nr:outer membrane beta-barrel protein [Bacteroidales bacterium]